MPTPAAPFKGKLEVIYETGSDPIKTTLAQVDSDVTLDAVGIVEKVEVHDSQLIATLRAGTEDYSDLPTLLVQAGYKITAFKEEEINLETAFMALTKGITA